MNQESSGLDGHWTHSFEEDVGGLRVYRRTASYPFPPTRGGRETLEFGSAGLATGQMAVGGPGPDDRPRSTPVRSTPLGMNRYRLEGTAQSPGQVIEIIEATPDLLRVRLV